MQDLTPQEIIARDRSRLAAALQTGVVQNPDEEAGLRREAQQRGMDPEVLRTAKAQKTPLPPPALSTWYDMPERAPRAAGFLSNPQNAAIAHDDTDNLSLAEQTMDVLKNIGGSLYSGLPRFSAGIVGRVEAAEDVSDAVLGAPFRAVERLLGTNVGERNTALRRQQRGDYRRYLSSASEAALAKSDNPIAQAAYSGVASIAPSALGVLVGMFAGPTAGAAVIAGPVGGEAYGRARDQGKAIVPALAYGETQASAEFLGERIGLGPLLDGLKMGSPFLQTFVKSQIAEQVGEQATTVLQDFTDYAMLNPDQTFAEFLAERPDAALQTAVATVVGSGATTTGAYAVQATAQRLDRNDRQRRAAMRDNNLVQQLNAVAEASKVRARSPETFEEFVGELAQDGPVDTLYVDAQTFNQTLEAAGISVADVEAAVPAVAEQLSNALRDGGDLAIPVEQFAARISGTDFAQPLLDHLRVNPALPSRAEVMALGQEANTALQAEVEAVLTAEVTTDAFRQSAERVKASLAEQLNTAGRFTKDVNDAYASLPAAYYTVRAAQLGITPEEMAARYPLQIRAELPTAAGQATLDQGRSERGEIFLHGSTRADLTLAGLETDGRTGTKQGKKGRSYGGFYVTAEESEAERYSKSGEGTATIYEVELKPGARVLELSRDGQIERLTPEQIQEWRAQGYAAVRGKNIIGTREEVAIIDKTQVQRLAPRAELPTAKGQSTLDQSAKFRSVARNALTLEGDGQAVVSQPFVNGAGSNAENDTQVLVGEIVGDAQLGRAESVPPLFRVIGQVRSAALVDAEVLDAIVELVPVDVVNDLFGSQAAAKMALRDDPMFQAGDTVDADLAIASAVDAATPVALLVDEAANLAAEGALVPDARRETSEGGPADGAGQDDGLGQGISPEEVGTEPTTLNQKNRAQIAFSGDITQSPSVISLLRTADLSSFLHETGHYFLEVDAHIASQPDAPAEVVADVERLLSWFGVTGARTEPAVADGFVRLYHSGSQGEGQSGRWVSTSRQYAADYRPELPLFYLDVPADDPRANDPTYDDQGVAQGFVFNFELTPEEAAQLRQIDREPAGPSALDTWNAMGVEEKRAYHEQFARGFEAFLLEGKSPTPELQTLFQRFRSWLLNVYKSLASLNVELTEEVRDVMGRMVASAEAIQNAEDVRHFKPLAETRPPYMTEQAWDEYQRAFAAATAEGLDTLSTRTVRDMKWLANARSKALKRLQAHANDARRQVRAEVTAEVNAEPVNRARRFITRGTDENNEPIPGAGKLDLATLREMYGEGEDALWRQLRRGGKYGEAGNDGIHPDVVAENFGFASGDALVRALISAENAQEKIAGLTDQRMLERYGDIADEQAMDRATDEAIANDARARVLATEYAALAEATGQPRALAAAARQYAAGIVNRIELKRLKPHQFFAASARAGRQADAALKKDDLGAAATAKRNQLVNMQAARYTLDAKREVDQALTLYKRIIGANDEALARSRDMALVNATRALLAQYGLTRMKNDPMGYLERVKAYDPQLYTDIEVFLKMGPANAKPFADMTFEEFQGMHDVVRQLWALSRRTRQIEIDGKLVDLELARKELGARLDELGYPSNAAGNTRAPTDAEKRGRLLQGARASLRRVESWTRGLDGDSTGAFRRYIWNPVSSGADRYRSAQGVYLQRFLDLVKPIEADLARKAKIEAAEIGYTFNSKAELLHAILHSGNQSNLSKLLLGRRWGGKTADGSLDTTQWDAFLSRMWAEGKLTKADYDFAQSVWDLLDELKPAAQEAHRQMYGRYFDEITADEFSTPFGTYRGGYVPATTDAFMVQDATLRAEQEAIEDSNSAMFPAASNGFTKSRVEDYTRELALDVRLLPMHIDKVLKFTYIGPPVRDVARLLKGRDFSAKLQAFDPVAQSDLLLPWLQRAAKQIVQTPTAGAAGKMVDTFFREMRSRTGMQLMFANLSNTAQQVTGFSNLALRVKKRNLQSAMWKYFRNPKGTAEAVTGLSSFMATRTTSQVFEARQTIEQMLLNPNKYEKLRDFSSRHAYFFQTAAQNFTDIIGWSAAYDQAVAQGQDDAEAVRFADSVIRETQGSMAPEDVSRAETGPAFMRMFTQFWSYFNNQANLLGTEFQQVARGVGVRKGAGRLFYIYLMGYAVPALMADAIAIMFRGGLDDDEDDGYIDELLQWFFMGQVKFGLAAVPVVGQVTNAAIGAFTDVPYDDRVSVSPAVSLIESGARLPAEVYQTIVEGESFNRRDTRDLMNLLGIISGTPIGALGRPVSYGVGVAQGDIEPTGPVDFTRGLVTGAPSPESRTN